MIHRPISKRLIGGLGSVALVLLLLAVGTATNARAANAPGLGAATSFAILGAETVTNTGPTTIIGDIGVSPGTAVTNFPPGIVTGGSIHSADTEAAQAQSAATTAYDALSAEPCTDDLTGQDLGGMILTAGVYCFTSSAQLTGLLRLDAEGNSNAVFIFKTVSTLTTATGSVVQVINGGNDCNVFWRVGSSAPIGVGTVFVGNIIALTSISLQTGATVSGRAFARVGEVTMDTNHVDFLACAAATATPTATAAPTDSPTPVPTATPVGQTPSPVPTDTPIGQTPSPTPVPTATPSPTPVGQTPSPTPVPTPSPSPTPVGQTPSPTPVPTPTPSPTPVVQTPSPTPVTPTPSATPATPTATPTLPPPEAPTNTPSFTPGPGFPNTGGPPAQDGLPWMPLLLGWLLCSLAVTALVLSRNLRSSPEQIRK